jgi:1-deoxy-D-xylulose-5-phosphate reductoisomerase
VNRFGSTTASQTLERSSHDGRWREVVDSMCARDYEPHVADGVRRGVAILGSTGSIGTTALALIERFRDRFRVVALSAGRRVGELKAQIERFQPSVVSVTDARDAVALREGLGAGAPRILHGEEGLRTVATAADADVVLSALVGAAGLEPTLAAVDAGRDIALANKEVMVVAGELIRRHAERSGSRLLPVDSEHNAVFQALLGRERRYLNRIVLTASGGPFRTHTLEQLARVTREEALAHPTWDMGAKISIDSATLMNKGLEVIEARWLFDVEPRCIDVLVHPQSIVHAMVEYRDGSVVAVLAVPDMTIPIAYALAYPEILDLGHLPALDLAARKTLAFEAPDTERFPCLRLAFEALAAGGTMPAVANAANEVAVARFLAGEIGFLSISRVIETVMHAHAAQRYQTVAELLHVDAWARRVAEQWAEERAVARA